MIEDTKLQLAAASRRSAIYSAIGLFVLIGSLIFSAAHLRSLSVRRSQLVRETQELDAKKNELQKTIDKMKDDVHYYASQQIPSVDIFIAREGQLSKANDAAEEIRKLSYDAHVQDEPDPKIRNTYVRY